MSDGAPPPVATMADVLALLNRSVSDVYSLENSLTRARVVAQLAGVMIKALEWTELEARLGAVEEAVYGKPKG